MSGGARHTRIRILVADDDAHLRAAIVDTLGPVPDMEVVGTAPDADAVVRLAAEQKPDVVLMDVRMPGGGATATRNVLAALPAVRVIGLSAYEDQSTVLEMLEAGAVAYLVKGSAEEEIFDAIRRAHRGQLSVSADLGTGLLRDMQREVRERRTSEAALRKSEERFQALLRAAPDAMVVIDSSGVIELVNEQAEHLFQYARGELVGERVEVLLPERFRQAHVDHRRGYMTDPRPRQMGAGLDLFGRRRDGTEFPVDISLSPLRTDEGLKAVAAIRDASDRKHVEALLRKNQERFRGLLESAPDAMVIVNADGEIQLVNARTEELFGYSREELIGSTVDHLVPERLQAVHLRQRSHYNADSRPRPMGTGLELFGRRKDGTEFPVDISLSPLETEEGVLVVAAVRDISARKQSERQLAQSVEVADRQRLFSHLVRVQEEERLRIASDIHDDTIQAMTAASLRLQQLRRRIADENDLELLGKLEQAVHESIVRLRRLMFDLRPPALDRSGLGPALRDLLDRLEEETGLSCMLRDELTTEPPTDVRIALYRIGQEALTNVRKHAQAGRVVVELARQQGGSLVRVIDDGTGFEAGEGAERPGHLGLVAMRERARMAGGWLKLTSSPGSGTVVEFWAPDTTTVDPALGPRPDG